MESNFEVGYLTQRASTASFSTPASVSAFRIASTFIEIVERSGKAPNVVAPIPAMTDLPLRLLTARLSSPIACPARKACGRCSHS